MFENDGSNALKQTEYAYIPEPEAAPELPEQTKPRRRKKPARGLTAQIKGVLFVTVIALFAMAGTVLMFTAELNTQYKLLGQKQNELNNLTSRVEQISSEIEGSGSLVAVEEKAVELGLQRADQSQIVYISLDNADSGEILAEDPGTGGLSLFLNKVAAIAEYLY